MKPKCKECDNRKVGCHSQCQQYIVYKVITQYKNKKKIEMFDNDFNYGQYSGNVRKLKRKLNKY